MRLLISALVALAASTGFIHVSAHPGEDHSAELNLRRRFLAENAANLNHCTDKIKARGMAERAAARRDQMAAEMRRKRGLDKRAVRGSHLDYTIKPDLATIFTEKSSCVLSPQEMEGPYYVAGEYIREELVEDQEGIILAFGIQFLDTTTCEPVVGAYVDVWSCNSTGIYGGVMNEENGNGKADPSNINKTWLRGVAKTDKDGIVSFITLFPGHYHGRAPHIHVLTHLNAKPNSDGTLIDSTAAHVGQMYFSQSIIDEVETRSPYNTNRQPLTRNKDDRALQEDLSAGGDPYMALMEMGVSVDDGMLGWISYGINTTYSREVKVVGTFHPDSGAPKETNIPFSDELK